MLRTGTQSAGFCSREHKGRFNLGRSMDEVAGKAKNKMRLPNGKKRVARSSDKREASTQCPPRTGITSEPTLNVTLHEVAFFHALCCEFFCPGTCTDAPGFICSGTPDPRKFSLSTEKEDQHCQLEKDSRPRFTTTWYASPLT